MQFREVCYCILLSLGVIALTMRRVGSVTSSAGVESATASESEADEVATERALSLAYVKYYNLTI